MTDREMLELAAKAAGIDVVRSRLDDPLSRDFLVNASVRNPHQISGPWNPITDDGDALRLAVKLQKMPVIERWSEGDDWVFIPGHEGAALPLGNDPLAATRHAITRTAAEIGKGMK